MEMLQSLLELYWTIIKSVFSNPYYIILLSLIILMKMFYPKFRGFMGEFWVKMELRKLSKKEYIVLNNIMIDQNNSTHQIDHLIVSKYGIFVIEMKNYYGMIVGEEYMDNWIQYLGKNKYYFKNPIHQNYGHVKALEELLKLDNKLFIPIVCFSNQAHMKVKTQSSIVQLDNLVSLIKRFSMVQINSDINETSNIIVKNNIVDRDKRKQHVRNINIKIKSDEEKSDNMICPKCGGNLVERNGKYGTFIGCSNYPKCKYIKK